MTENEHTERQTEPVPPWLAPASGAASTEDVRALRAQVQELTDAVRALTASVEVIGRITRTRLETLALLAMTSSPR